MTYPFQHIYPDTPAIIATDRTLTYGDLENAVDDAAQDIAPANIVAFDAPPTSETIITLLAILQRSAIACPLNTRWPAATRDAALLRIGLTLLDTKREAALILFTSGSSASPKAAVLSQANLHHNAAASNQNIPLSAGDRWLLSLPLYHVSGIGVLWRCFLAGASIAVPDTNQPLESALEALKPTHVSLVPTQLHRLLQSSQATQDLQRCKAILLGGGPIPATLLDAACDADLAIHTTYGMTESASQIATTPPNCSRNDFGKAPVLIPNSVRIAPNGEIQVQGPTLFLGYLEDGKTVRPSTPDGWFPTGDLGSLDAQGRLSVTGRKDNLFISGGENIQPETIEHALLQHPTIDRAIIAPRPDPEFGHRPAAFLQTADGAPPDVPALEAHLRARLPGYMIPIAWWPWPVDWDASMKMPRSEARRRAAEARSAG